MPDVPVPVPVPVEELDAHARRAFSFLEVRDRIAEARGERSREGPLRGMLRRLWSRLP
jgi:hypothetical protein